MIEDQVITPKYKFDQMENSLKDYKLKDYEILKEEVANTINIYLEVSNSDRYHIPIGIRKAHISIRKGENIPDSYIENIRKIQLACQEHYSNLLGKESELDKKLQEIHKFQSKIELYPSWVRWILNV
jgi:hypothetical protein